jgi:hypothetical protein
MPSLGQETLRLPRELREDERFTGTQFFDLPGLDHEASRFLEWCRLDDYNRHVAKDLRRRKKQLRKKIEGKTLRK